jgi:hypothetical protein
MRTLTFAAAAIASLVTATSGFAEVNSVQPAPGVPPAATAGASRNTQPKSTRHPQKSVNPHVLARPYASPHNGAASAIGAE